MTDGPRRTTSCSASGDRTHDVTRPTGGPAAIVCRGLTKRFGAQASGVLAVDRLDLEIPAGSVFGLLGPNGAGKTTTLRMLTGLARPTEGHAEIGGHVVRPDDAAIRATLGVLEQAPRFYGWMTGAELVGFAGRLAGMDDVRLGDRVDEVLGQVGLADAGRRRIGTYSGGMRQRLGIAAALVAEPAVLILDEPVSSLDPEGRRDLLALIAGLRRDATVVFSTHVLDDVERICDRVGILDAGRLLVDAPLDELLARYAVASYRLELAPGDVPALESLRAEIARQAWCESVASDAAGLVVALRDEAAASRQLLALVVAAQVRLIRFEQIRPTLEDVFLRLVGRRPASKVA
jgi:ABC-2 type transport system ATP-binding protein